MIYRILVSLFFSVVFAYAQPSLAQVKQAVSANPALLETPQAKAMMKEKGVSVAEVKQKLAESSSSSTSETATEDVDNSIDTSVTDTISENKELKTDFKDNILAKRVNPFFYKTNAKIREELKSKQQRLSKSKLSRYSMSFYANKNTIDASSLPTPDNYIVSTGDMISVHIYGDRDKNYKLEVKNDRTVELDFIGPVVVGGMSFKEAKRVLKAELQAHYQNSEFSVNIAKYTTIQVTLVGDVKYPGIYNLSSFSTVKELLIAAKGVRKSASVRNILIRRNGRTVAHLDFYELLFKGNRFGTKLLKQGDIVIIKKAKKLVSIDGYVKNAAYFELKGSETLATLINYAGGMKPDASKLNIKVTRYSNNSKLETYKLSLKEAKKFSIQDGDKVYVYPLDFTANSSISLYGNIIRPGSYRLTKDKTLNSFLKKSLKDGLKNFFLPQTYFEYGVIKRYNDDLTYSSKSFNLAKVINNEQRVELKPNDQVFIFSKNDIFTNSYVITKGSSLVKAGKLQYFRGMGIKDAINASGIDGFIDDKVKVTTYNTKDFMPKTSFYSLKHDGNLELSPYDEVEVYDYYAKHILEPVTIKGEVVKPTKVFYEDGMTLKNILSIAGGFNKRAYLKRLEIVRYHIDKNQNRQRDILQLDLEGKNLDEIKLKPYDEITVFKIPNWNDRKSITLKGEVKFPGTYAISNGEKLGSVLRRAGGFTKDAFIGGSVFTRESVKKNQIEQYNRALSKIKRELAIYNAMPANAKNASAMAQSSGTLNEVILEAKKYQPVGRVSIILDSNLTKIQESEYNLVLKDKDTLTIPSKIDTVTVFGEVFNPTSFIYNSEYNVDDYIKLASGYSRSADTSSVYVIHADGRSEPVNQGWFGTTVEIKKGDTIVVPIYIKEYNTLEIWNSVAKVLSSFAVTAAALDTLGVFE